MSNINDTYPMNEICLAYGTWGKNLTEFNITRRFDVYCLFYIIKGEGHITINGRTFFVSVGQSVLLFPFSRIDIKSNEKNPLKFNWIKFRGFDAAKLISNTSFTRENPIVGSIPVDNFEQFFNVSPLRGVPYAACRSNSKFLMLISYYLEYYPSESQQKTNYAKKAREYIEKHYNDPECTVHRVAEFINLDRTYLYKLFKDETGTSIIDYINRCRISNASALLKDKNTSVKDVAYSVGFTDQMYFSRVFKRVNGISPSEFRAISQGNT